jgi:GNAT superfamily N-acetyltransferase
VVPAVALALNQHAALLMIASQPVETPTMIRACAGRDIEAIWAIINDGAEAYRGAIPPDRLRSPYMSRAELLHEIEAGVTFWGYANDGEVLGVMGLQDVQDVTLIRHAYVRTANQRSGIGAHLLGHLRQLTARPILIGTWADAAWAIRFYSRHGFEPVGREEKERLLKRYWTIPDRQIETSVVLADDRWRASHPASVG